jgi:hypothetical protein
MSTNSTQAAITTTRASIQIITTEMTYYGPIILLVVGIVGCLCNFITFTAPRLRNNSCAFYFLMSAVFDLLSITFGLISRFAADQLGSKLINTDRAYCKLRAYLVSALPLVATYLVLLSSIDRCMASSLDVRFRSFSQIKMAYRAVAVAIGIGFISCSHILVSYDLRPKCGTMPGSYATFDGMFVVFWLGVIPHVSMLVFGFLTFMNIKRSKRRVTIQSSIHPPAFNQQQKQRGGQRTDQQLIVVSNRYQIAKVAYDEKYFLDNCIRK